MPPPAPCRVLVVDDSEDDAELVRRALARGGLPCTIARVDDAAALRRALADATWDVVIADYSQPSFGALCVLTLLRDLGSDLPCVVISGVAGEDRAVETMRAGAKDFVSKDRLQRLAPAVQRELAESANRRERARESREEALRDRRMYDAGAFLFELLRGGDFTTGDTAAVYGALTELVARTLDVDRVSVWMFEEAQTVFRCVQAYDRRDGGWSRGDAYEVSENAEYFRALEWSRFVESHGTCGDRRTHPCPWEAPQQVTSQLDAAIRLRGEMVGALCLDHLDANRRWHRDEQVFVGSIADLVSLAIEASERRRAEVALGESEVRYRELWENALDGMVTIATDGRITAANEAAGRLLHLRLGEVAGRAFTDFIAPADDRAARRTFAALVQKGPRAGDTYAFSLRRSDGRLVQVEATAQRVERNGSRPEILAIVRDVSQRRQLEAQLQQSQKMEAIGRLAGGVAHDFNNLLTAIIGYSQIAGMRPDMPPPAVGELREITSAAQRAAALTRQLLAFSRRQVLAPQVLDMNTVVSGIEVLLRRLIGEDVQLNTDLEVDVGQVLADPSQLEQVILNLAVNARDAMPHGGRIVLRTRRVAELHPGALFSAEPPAGPFVVLEVADSGVGMDEATHSRIFEPFFTTKASGTGLGLSTVYGIVQQSGGGIAVTSEPGRGSTFSVYLPVAMGDSDHRTPQTGGIGPTGSETVLLVEDDEWVRTLASRVLRLSGYTVLEAAEPGAALALAAPDLPIDLVVTDLVLPVMGGRELLQHLREGRPRLRVLFMSGYDDEDDGSDQGEEAFLSKPFTPDVLTTAVRAVLDREPVPAA